MEKQESPPEPVRGVHTIAVLVQCNCGKTMSIEDPATIAGAASGATIRSQCPGCGTTIESNASASMRFRLTQANVNRGPNRRQRRVEASMKRTGGGIIVPR